MCACHTYYINISSEGVISQSHITFISADFHVRMWRGWCVHDSWARRPMWERPVFKVAVNILERELKDIFNETSDIFMLRLSQQTPKFFMWDVGNFLQLFVAKTQFLMRSFQLILCQHDLFLTLSNCFLCLPVHKHSVENQPWRNVKLQNKDTWCFNLSVFKEMCITNIIPLTR